MPRSPFLAALAAAVLLGPSSAVAAPSVPYDPAFSGVELRWSNSATTSVFYSLRRDGAQVLVCGFYFSEGVLAAASEDALLRRSRLRAGHQTVMANISHFNRIDPDTPPEQVRATCKPGRNGWQDSYAGAQVRLRPPMGGFQ